MKANITYSSNPMVNSMLTNFNSLRPEFQQTINEGHQQFMTNIGGAGNMFSQQFEKVNTYYNNNPQLTQAVENLTLVGKLNDDIHIYPINMENQNHIGHNMRRYVMAEPEINRLYKLNRIDGFQGEWVDNTPDTKPTERGDYLAATSDMLMFDENGDGFVRHYVSSEADVLTTIEKISIKESWDFMKSLIANGEDPTII